MQGMRRPRAVTVPRSALVPPPCVVAPPPNQFTHRLRARQGYFYGARATGRPSGYFPKGSEVVLMVYDGGRLCRVIDGDGLYVLTAYAGLESIGE